MIRTLAIANYRSLLNFSTHLDQLNLITGANGSGKSNCYRALRLLASASNSNIVSALAHEGGLSSALWAGPEKLTRSMRKGEVPVQGGPRQQVVRLKLGFSTESLGYSIALGLPTPSASAFQLDPEIKHEAIWAGAHYRQGNAILIRDGAMVKYRIKRRWHVMETALSQFDSVFTEFSGHEGVPELQWLRDYIRSWRFYDQFRSDADAPARQLHIGTRTPILHPEGQDLAAALQTIMEVGDEQALQTAIDDAFPGSRIEVTKTNNGWFGFQLHQPGLLRPLKQTELSDGTLRYILWVAALLSPRPPPLIVLNEPENSLHPDLLPALAKLIQRAANNSQVWVISHANRLLHALDSDTSCHPIQLEKELGATCVQGVHSLARPAWYWPD